jgi:two-component system, OmpR family, phosphate regulon sensor histidine kinase PhoR
MKLSDLITSEEINHSDCQMAVGSETPISEALKELSEKGSDHIWVKDSVCEDSDGISQKDIIRGILIEFDGMQDQLEQIKEKVNVNDSEQLGSDQTKSEKTAVKDHKLAVAFSKMNEGLIILDSQFRVERVNASAKRNLGIKSDADNKEVSAVVDRVGIRNLLALDNDQSNNDKGVKIRVGAQKILNIRWNRISASESISPGFVVMINDATEEIATENIKTDFIAAISHELRTPVTSIQNSVSNILAGVTGRVNKKTRKYLEVMEQDCKRFAGLISDLLDIAKLQAGSLPVNRRIINIASVINESVKEIGNKAQRKGLKVNFNYSKNFSPVFVDSNRIKQALWNLIDNAIEFTDPGGSIMVGAYDKDDNVIVFVQDTGIGICQERRRRIFDKFYQINRQAGAGYKGTGLGLAICQGIVSMHGGEIWVDSQKGQGSTFSFSIPKCDPATALREHTNMLSERCRRKDDEFALLVMKMDFPEGADEQSREVAELVINEVVSGSVVFLTNKEDLIVKTSDFELSIIIRGSFRSRIKEVKEKLHKIVSNRLKNNLNKAAIMPMLGMTVYPSGACKTVDMERNTRNSLMRFWRDD